ncbi:hypothetical protein [Haliangium ochraceum]|uniref:Uncharacterized protein n=1 Tax=Haliangium ochraceum (strain DSM 14365 / JCM 11303 / SMP-2) TaxID=502025 RepID=D0LG82_HALO1|nr:hypothetical protein [Haliangium ochraceum]ACY18107.1 conserved hypothetical protein [Haliangium ochraceum DSM 14365]
MLRTLLVSFALSLVVGLSASTAFAQEAGADQKVKSYDFSGDTIDGDLLSPDGDVVEARVFANHSSLIRIRTDFLKEILKSAEDL